MQTQPLLTMCFPFNFLLVLHVNLTEDLEVYVEAPIGTSCPPAWLGLWPGAPGGECSEAAQGRGGTLPRVAPPRTPQHRVCWLLLRCHCA